MGSAVCSLRKHIIKKLSKGLLNDVLYKGGRQNLKKISHWGGSWLQGGAREVHNNVNKLSQELLSIIHMTLVEKFSEKWYTFKNFYTVQKNASQIIICDIWFGITCSQTPALSVKYFYKICISYKWNKNSFFRAFVGVL